MSRPNAVAVVTRTLAAMLDTALQSADSSFRVTTLPLDKSITETNPPNRLNLYLFHVAHHAAWRNTDLPDRTAPGEPGSPPLGLTLSYLLTAHGEALPEVKDHHILGVAMQFLHNHPILTSADIQAVDATSGLQDQIERVRFIPKTLTIEELSRLWGAFQTQYRVSVAYEASVVLIDPAPSGPGGAPVLRRGEDDRGVFGHAALPPTLTRIVPPELLRRAGQSVFPAAARLGQTLTIEGERLTADGTLLLIGTPAWGIRRARIAPLTPGPRPDTLLATLAVPPVEDAPVPGTPPLAWAPGIYSAALVFRATGHPDVVSNAVPFALAPDVVITPLTASPGNLDLMINCTPSPRVGQPVFALLTGRDPMAPTTATLPPQPQDPAVFRFFLPGLVAGEYLVRLRVDGIDTMPYRVVTPPGGAPRLEFDPGAKLIVA